MAVEVVRIKYTRLFEVRLLHHYWLDDGPQPFESIGSPAEKANRLLTYDARRFLSVEASPSTLMDISGLRGVVRMTNLGLLVAVPHDTVVPLSASWEFFLTAASPEYRNYTALSLRPQSITDALEPSDPPKIHRYKSNVPVLSNDTGVAKTVNGETRLFLSRPYPVGAGAADGVEALFRVGSELRQLMSDPPSAGFRVLAGGERDILYVNQSDVPAIVPPAGVADAVPPAGIEMGPDTPPDVLAVIRLSPRREGSVALSFVKPNGTPIGASRIFEVHLPNRWTYRRYRNRATGAVSAEDDDPHPLTYLGNAGGRQKPSTTDVTVELTPAEPSRIARLVSDVYL